MKAKTVLALPVLLLATGSFAADDFPDLKPGLWTNAQSMTGTPSSVPPMTGQMCTNNEVFKSYQHLSKDPDNPCKLTSQSHAGSTYTSETDCKFDTKVTHAKTVMTVTGDTALHMQVNSSDGIGMVLDMKYVGACPAGMAVGDYQMSNGMKMNVLTGTSSGRPAH